MYTTRKTRKTNIQIATKYTNAPLHTLTSAMSACTDPTRTENSCTRPHCPTFWQCRFHKLHSRIQESSKSDTLISVLDWKLNKTHEEQSNAPLLSERVSRNQKRQIRPIDHTLKSRICKGCSCTQATASKRRQSSSSRTCARSVCSDGFHR